MVIVLWLIIVVLGAIALFYRSKAKEFESLFELSKGYSTRTTIYLPRQVIKSLLRYFDTGCRVEAVNEVLNGEPITRWIANGNMVLWTDSITSPKLNKDGSIAKKRGRKSNVKTT